MTCPDCNGTMIKALLDRPKNGLIVVWLCNCETLGVKVAKGRHLKEFRVEVDKEYKSEKKKDAKK